MNSKIITLFSLIGVLCLVSCGGKTETGETALIHETKFNSSYIALTNEELQAKGFKFGDSCDVYYSNGKSILDVPYYDGYYTRSDFPLICGYQGYPDVQITINNSSDFWDRYELSEDDTVNIVLNKSGKYLTEQETFSMHYFNEREKYSSDTEFANFRCVETSGIAKNRLYRGASPFNNTYNRASYVDNLLKGNDVKFILDLSDSESDMETYKNQEGYDASASYAYQQDKVFLNMGSNFRMDLDNDGTVEDDEENEHNLCSDLLTTFVSSSYKESLVRGLNEMILNPGPYYVHCVEGKDRTGFVCMLLEALCGASYQEMQEDYMKTYANYFGITTESDKDKYDAVVDLRFNEFMEYLSSQKDNLENISYSQYAREYLTEGGGMSEENVNKLIECLTK